MDDSIALAWTPGVEGTTCLELANDHGSGVDATCLVTAVFAVLVLLLFVHDGVDFGVVDVPVDLSVILVVDPALFKLEGLALLAAGPGVFFGCWNEFGGCDAVGGSKDVEINLVVKNAAWELMGAVWMFKWEDKLLMAGAGKVVVNLEAVFFVVGKVRGLNVP